MHNYSPYKRRVRIESAPNATNGYMVTVHDADTGEAITNICEAIVYLRVNSINEVAITYYEQDDNGTFKKGPDSVIKKRGISVNPEVDVLAMERRSWLETVVFQALGEASMCWEERPRGRFQGEEAKRIGDELIAILERHYLSAHDV